MIDQELPRLDRFREGVERHAASVRRTTPASFEADLVDAPADHPGLTYHAHCQQRTLDADAHTVAVLEALGYDVATTDVECCGMAGSFGYKTDYYDLSVAVGEDLLDQLDDDRQTVASGTSCQEQIADLAAADVRHPVELVAPSDASARF
ncbi:MAG: hypothetical protein A07HB70_01860 [uncultured archaeon A07HB70]|nr:MAG: hypothetical protein A07HB70_01860 [uncultured archaeon A07HB70]